MNDSWLGFTGPRRLDGPDLSLDLGQSTNCHLYTQSSSPFTQQSHDTCSQQYTEYHEAQSLIVFGPQWIKQEVSGKKLDKSSVDQDASTDGVQDTRYNVGGVRVRVVGRANTKTDGDRDWSGQTVCGAQEPWQPAFLGERYSRHSSTNTKTLERLMENKDWVEGRELLANDAQVESDNDLTRAVSISI